MYFGIDDLLNNTINGVPESELLKVADDVIDTYKDEDQTE